MVATRRGTRVGSPVKSTSDENPGVTQPTPSTRRTRRRTLIEENQSQSDSQPDEPKDDSTASSLPSSPPKRNTRRSTRIIGNKKQPDSTHEADVSESESCCSVASDVLVTPRTRRRTVVREKRVVQDEASEAESCSSAVSATCSRRAPRSLRKRVLTSAASKDDAKDVDYEDPSGAESCSSAVSFTKGKDTQRLTRSQRKGTEADQSEPDSCSSSVSGLHGSVVRRSTRNQKVKVTEPIPLSLEETTDTPSSPVSRNLRGRRRKTEDDAYESDGCKSGPSTSPWRFTRRQQKVDTVVVESDLESVATDICTSHGSPSPQRGKGTPCSSRTGSASSNRAVPVTRIRSRAKVATEDTTAATMPEEQKEGEDLDRDKAEDIVEQLDSTITMDTSEAQECTIIEEGADDTIVVFDQEEPVEPQSLQNVEVVEGRGTETLTIQEQAVTETMSTLPEDKQPDDVAMENEPELEETSHVVEVQTCSKPTVEAAPVDSVPDVVEKVVVDETCPEPVKEGTVKAVEDDPVPTVVDNIVEDQAYSEPVKEDPVEATPEDPEPAVVEEKVEFEKKGVIVIEEANDTVNTTENDSVPLNDLEGPSTSSHIQVNLSSTEEACEEPSSKKEIISLLDSSEDEDSADEGLSSGEEGCAQEAKDVQREGDGMSPDENQMSEEAEACGNGLFVIDTRPGLRPKEQYYVDKKQTEEEDEEDFVDEEGDEDDDEDSKVLFTSKKAPMQLSSSIDTGLKMKELGGLYISFDGNKPKSLSKSIKIQKDLDHPDELLKKSVIVPDFEKKDAVPPYKESKQAAKLKRKAEREKTTGDGWFNMKAPEVTEELKNDLKALKMRSAMDPKRFYKKNDREGFPKYFQVGTVVDSPVDFYNSRIPKKQRKRTIVEELLADAEFRSSNKRKYQEIMAEKAAQSAGKQHRKKHKFHKKKMNK